MIGVQIGVQNAAVLAEFHRIKPNNPEQNFPIESAAYWTSEIIAERRRMQEPKVAKVGVEGSNPFARSRLSKSSRAESPLIDCGDDGYGNKSFHNGRCASHIARVAVGVVRV